MKNISDKTALTILKWSWAFINFMPIMPIIVLLYQNKGVSIGEFFMIEGIFRLVSFLFEIPSGYLADVFSRKKILLIGAIIELVSVIWLIWAHGFWGVLLCEAGMGLANALFSGTREAYTFDLLKRMKKENQYLKENGGVQTFAQTAAFIATLSGGFLYAMGVKVVLLVEAAAAGLAVLFFAKLPEIQEVRRKIAPESSPLRDLMGIVKMSVKHPELKWLMTFPAIYGGFTLIMFWILQPMMSAAMVPVALFGLFVGINHGSRALFSKIAHKAKEFFGVRKLLFLCLGLLASGFIAAILAVNSSGNMAFVYAISGFVAIIPATQTMAALIFKDYIHHKIKSDERGTILSINSMFSTGITGTMMILAKPMLDNFGITATMLVCLGALIVILFPLKKVLAIKGIEK